MYIIKDEHPAMDFVKKNKFSIAGLAILLIALPVMVIVAQKRFDLFSRAANTPCYSDGTNSPVSFYCDQGVRYNVYSYTDGATCKDFYEVTNQTCTGLSPTPTIAAPTATLSPTRTPTPVGPTATRTPTPTPAGLTCTSCPNQYLCTTSSGAKSCSTQVSKAAGTTCVFCVPAPTNTPTQAVSTPTQGVPTNTTAPTPTGKKIPGQ